MIIIFCYFPTNVIHVKTFCHQDKDLDWILVTQNCLYLLNTLYIRIQKGNDFKVMDWSFSNSLEPRHQYSQPSFLVWEEFLQDLNM